MALFAAQSLAASLAAAETSESQQLLALNVIERDFGGRPWAIASHLIKTSGATLAQLEARFCSPQGKVQQHCWHAAPPCRLTPAQVSSVLLLLQQHGCLVSELPHVPSNSHLNDAADAKDKSAAAKHARQTPKIVYSIDLTAVLRRLHIPRAILLARKAVEDAGGALICEILVEELYMNGRQELASLKVQVGARLTALRRGDVDSSGGGQTERVQECFDLLVERGFIVAENSLCTKPRSVLQLPPKSKGAKNKRHLGVEQDSRKKRKRDSDSEDEADEEQHASARNQLSTMRHIQPLSDNYSSRFVGDGEWKEDAGFGPITEEPIFDADYKASDAHSYHDPEAMEVVDLSTDTVVKDDPETISYPAPASTKAHSNSLSITSTNANTNTVSRRGLRIEDSDELMVAASAGFENSNSSRDGNEVGRDAGAKTYWSVGWAHVLAEERHEECVRYVSERMQARAGRVVRIILDASSRLDSASELSAPVKVSAILSEYRRLYGGGSGLKAEGASPTINAGVEIKSEGKVKGERSVGEHKVGEGMTEIDTTVAGGDAAATEVASVKLVKVEIKSETHKAAEKPMDLPSLRKLLHHLVEDRCLTEVNNGNTPANTSAAAISSKEYRANVGEIIRRMKSKTIHSVASQRFGVHAARIIELLTVTDELIEQGRVSDKAIMPAKEGREHLYKLYRDRWITYRGFCKRVDFAPTSTQYFWQLDQLKLRSILLEHCYKTLLNLRLCLGAAEDQEDSVLGLAAVKEEGKSGEMSDGAKEEQSRGRKRKLQLLIAKVCKTVSMLTF